MQGSIAQRERPASRGAVRRKDKNSTHVSGFRPRSASSIARLALQKRLRVAARLLHKAPGLSPGASLIHHILPANWRILEWACLDSNQGPLPYQRQLHMLWMFIVVQKCLQISTFLFYGCSACSLLFTCVVAKLSSVLGIPPHWPSHPATLRLCTR